jgi:DNA polymerase IIIc chi subunit
MKSSTVIMLAVKSAQAKLTAIAETIEKHFALKQRILVRVDNDAAADYIDKLLWRMPAAGLLPHRIASHECRDAIAIGIGAVNWNNATMLFNLGADAHPNLDQFETIYDLMDHTSEEKLSLSQKRLAKYDQYQVITQVSSPA